VKDISSREKALQVARFAAEKKGQNIVLMDMGGVSAMCDWFVILSVNSSRSLKAVSKNIQKSLSKEKFSPLNVEGENDPFWTLLDYEDVIVHVFLKEIREFYGLESLWSDAPKEIYEEKCLPGKSKTKSQKSL